MTEHPTHERGEAAVVVDRVADILADDDEMRLAAEQYLEADAFGVSILLLEVEKRRA